MKNLMMVQFILLLAQGKSPSVAVSIHCHTKAMHRSQQREEVTAKMLGKQKSDDGEKILGLTIRESYYPRVMFPTAKSWYCHWGTRIFEYGCEG